MPLLTLTDKEALDARAKAGSDILFLFAENDIDDAIQLVLFHAGITTAKSLQGFEDSREGLRKVLKDQIGLDGCDGLDQRVQVAAILSAWESAATYIKKENDSKAEARESGQSRPVSTEDLEAMRLAVASDPGVGDIRDEECPGRFYLGEKLAQVEKNHPLLEALTTVTTTDGGEAESIPGYDSQGRLRFHKGPLTVPQPRNPEQLRKRHRTIAFGWMMASKRHANRSWLKGMDQEIMRRYDDYLLGDDVYGLSLEKCGEVRALEAALVYDAEIRKLTYKLVRGGKGTLKECLEKAWTDTDLRALKFMEPHLAAHAKGADDKGARAARGRADREESGDNPPKRVKREAAEGESKSKSGMYKQLPKDGTPLCFRWNGTGKACGPGCAFAHKCQNCLGSHPLRDCPTHGRNAADKATDAKKQRGKGGGRNKGKTAPWR